MSHSRATLCCVIGAISIPIGAVAGPAYTAGGGTVDNVFTDYFQYSYRNGAYTSPQEWDTTNALGAYVIIGPFATGKANKTDDAIFALDGSAISGRGGGVAIGDSAAVAGETAVALGAHASAPHNFAIAVGGNATANGIGAIAVGREALATGYYSVAHGFLATTSGTGAIGIGQSATATGLRAIALGTSGSLSAAGNTAADASYLGATAANAAGTDSISIGTGASSGATNAIALGTGARATAAGSLALGAGATTTADLSLAGYQPGSAAIAGIASPTNGEVSLGAAGTERRLTNVAAGAVATDAVNVSQLQSADAKLNTLGTEAARALGGTATYDAITGTISAPTYSVGGTTVTNVGDALTNLDGRTTQNSTAITDLNTQISTGAVGLVQQDATSRDITVAAAQDGTRVSFAGTAGNRVLTGVAAGAVGASSVEAVNGSQLFGTANSMATALGGNAGVNADGTLRAPTYSVGGTTVTNVGDAVTNLDGRTTQNSTAITDLSTQISTGAVGLVQQDATSRDITVAAAQDGTRVSFAGTAGNRVLTGVAAGAVGASSVEAVNGSQLFGTANSMATALGGNAGVNADGTLRAPTYSVGGTTVSNVGDAVTNLDGRVTNVESSVTQITTQINTGQIGLVKQDPANGNITVAADLAGDTVSMSGTAGTRRITGVAAGTIAQNSTDAVNGAQVFALSQQIGQMGKGSPYFQADGAGDGSDIPVARAGSHSVAMGSAAQANGDNSAAVGAGANAKATNSVALGAGAVADRSNTVSVGAKGAERQIASVAPATEETDAVNLGQLREYSVATGSQVLNQANAYTDQQVSDARRDASAGTAAAMAMAGLPQATLPGKGMVAVSGSTYKGMAAVALGVSHMSGTGKWVYKANVSADGRGSYGGTVGAGFHW